MEALPQGDAQAIDAIAALQAGNDLLLCVPDQREGRPDRGGGRARRGTPAVRRRRAARERRPPRRPPGAARRGAGAGPRRRRRRGAPCARARRSRIARSRSCANRDGLLPLRLEPGASILAVMPRPRALTPADTSDSVEPGLAAALRAHWPDVREIVTSHPPTDDEIAGVVAAAADATVTVVGTIAASADPAQAVLVDALLATGRSGRHRGPADALGPRRVPDGPARTSSPTASLGPRSPPSRDRCSASARSAAGFPSRCRTGSLRTVPADDAA